MTIKKISLRPWLSLGLIACLATASQLLAQNSARGENVHFRGPISAIGRTAEGYLSILTIRVNRSEVQISLNTWTQVFGPRGFAIPAERLRLGDFIEVSGFFTKGGRILGQRIHLESGDAVGVEGTVESLAGSKLRVNGILFETDDSSVIRKTGSVRNEGISVVREGDIVRIRARYVAGQLRIIELEDGARSVESDPLRLEGLVTFTNGTLMYVDVGIRNDRGGIIPAFVAINSSTQIIGTASPGTRVEVEGRFLPGQSLIQATRITTDDDRDGNPYDYDESGSPIAHVEMKGIVADLQRGAGETGRLRIDTTWVQFDQNTEIRRSDSARLSSSDLQNGQKVEVTGNPLKTGFVHALVIEIEVEDSPSEGEHQGPVVELTGKISGVVRQNNGSVTEFFVSSTRILLDQATRVEQAGAAVSSSLLQNGLSVEVKGWQQSDQSVLASVIIIKTEPDEPGDGELVEVKGAIQDLVRQPDDSVTRIQVNNRLIVIQSTTEIKGPSGEVPSSALEMDQEVEVKGIERADLSILAEEIEIK